MVLHEEKTSWWWVERSDILHLDASTGVRRDHLIGGPSWDTYIPNDKVLWCNEEYVKHIQQEEQDRIQNLLAGQTWATQKRLRRIPRTRKVERWVSQSTESRKSEHVYRTWSNTDSTSPYYIQKPGYTNERAKHQLGRWDPRSEPREAISVETKHETEGSVWSKPEIKTPRREKPRGVKRREPVIEPTESTCFGTNRKDKRCRYMPPGNAITHTHIAAMPEKITIHTITSPNYNKHRNRACEFGL